MRVVSIVCAAAVVALLGGCGGGGGHDSPQGPTEDQLRAREDAAATELQGFLYSFVDGGGLPNEAYLLPSFNLDGWDRSQYLEQFWDAEGAADIGDGVVQILYGTESDGSFYNLAVTDSASPFDLSLPVVVELALKGETDAGGAPAFFYDALWYFFMVEDANDLFSITAQAPTWEYEVPAATRDEPRFVLGEVMVNNRTVYAALGESFAPSFARVKIQSTPGVTLPIDIALASYPPATNAVLTVRVTGRLFYEDSPTAQVNDVVFSQTVQDLWADPPFVTGDLKLPNGLAAGWYTLLVYVENTPYGRNYDLISLPIEITP